MMEKQLPFYGEDLAWIHDTGYRALAEQSAPGLLKILADAGIHGGRVVDLGCGTGIWAARLVEAGYSVVGCDLSDAALEIARRSAPSAEFHAASIWEFAIPRCRAVTALGEVVCYRTGEEDRPALESLFRQVFEALEPGGLLILDVAEVGLDRKASPRAAEGDGWACQVRFDYDESRDRLTRHITTFRQVGSLYRRTYERHFVQLYRAADVAQWLRAAGFRVQVVRRFGAYTLLPKRVGFVARKPGPARRRKTVST